MYHTCPVCEDESIETQCHFSPGGYWEPDEGEIVFKQTCKCELTADQVEAIEKADLCEPDDGDY